MIDLNGATYITALEAPDYLGDDVRPATVRKWRQRGKLTGYPVGQRTHYLLDDLVEVEYETRQERRGRARAA